MARRGRARKVGQTRMDAAIDALTPMGFPKDLITRKVEDLLEIYDGEWIFIEESSYKVLIDIMLEGQEEGYKNTNDGDSASDCDEPPNTSCATEPSSAHNDAEPSNTHGYSMSNIHDGPEPSYTRSGGEYRSAECINERDATCVPQAGTRQQWKDISCILPECPQEDGKDSGSRGLGESGVQGALDLSSPAIRRPCYGWIGDDDEDDCVFFVTEASLRKEMRRGIISQKERKRRWDVKKHNRYSQV